MNDKECLIHYFVFTLYGRMPFQAVGICTPANRTAFRNQIQSELKGVRVGQLQRGEQVLNP